MNKTNKNLIANCCGKIWTMISSIIFVPIYIKLLGEEAYGIVTFFTVLQTVLNLMGAGLQKTLRREFSNNNDEESVRNQKKYKLLRSIENIYFLISIIIIVVCLFGSEIIANNWLHYETLDSGKVATAIFLMGCSIAFQLISHLYIGGIFGLDKHVTANVCQIAWSSVKNIGVIIILTLIYCDLISYYLWFVLIDLIYCILLRFVLVKNLKCDVKLRWSVKDFSNLKLIWKYTLGLLIISFGSALNTQLDKIIMSGYLPVSACGAYNTVFTISNLITTVPSIVGVSIFTEIASLNFANKDRECYILFSKYNRITVIIISALSAFMMFFSFEIVLIWTGSQEYAEIVKFAGPLIILGVSMNALQVMAYNYFLAVGNTKPNVIQLICCIPYVLTITLFLTIKLGVNGAAIAWAIEMVISTILYLIYFYKKTFKVNGFLYSFKDVFLIFLCAILFAFVFKVVISALGMSSLWTLILAVLAGGISLIILIVIFDRKSVVSLLRKVKR